MVDPALASVRAEPVLDSMMAARTAITAVVPPSLFS
jgi:hypothetical protein